MTAWEFVGEFLSLSFSKTLELFQLESPFGFTYFQLAVGCFVISLSIGILSALLSIAGGTARLAATDYKHRTMRDRQTKR